MQFSSFAGSHKTNESNKFKMRFSSCSLNKILLRKLQNQHTCVLLLISLNIKIFVYNTTTNTSIKKNDKHVNKNTTTNTNIKNDKQVNKNTTTNTIIQNDKYVNKNTTTNTGIKK